MTSSHKYHGGQPRSLFRLATGIFLCLIALFGCGLMLRGWTAPLPESPPQPANSDPPLTAPPSGSERSTIPALEYSPPKRIDIDVIDVHAPIEPVETGDEGNLGVPDVDDPHMTGWYEHGPAPGEQGSAAIVGHVDSARTGPAVFFYLGDLSPGDEIEVTREDGLIATFKVDDVASYSKKEFPYAAVFGDPGASALRLITCGGTYDKKSASYPDNIVAYATLASVRRAGSSDTPEPLRTSFPDKPNPDK